MRRNPSAARVLEVFGDTTSHRLRQQRQVIQIFEPTLTTLQRQLLELLGIPAAVYLSSADTE